MASHSPGPWTITELPFDECGQQEPDYRIEAASTLFLTVSPCADGFQFGQNEANARLIAAAPELLAAVGITLSDLEANIAAGNFRSNPDVILYRDQLKALVAKATGNFAPHSIRPPRHPWPAPE